MYRINYWSPNVDKMSGCGFSIKLFKEFKDNVAASGIEEDQIYTAIKKLSPMWLKSHGFDPEYDRISVQWGEFGPEHISVPGNACGLDITTIMCREGEAALAPHNVDSLKQASLILTIFCWIENAIYLQTLKD